MTLTQLRYIIAIADTGSMNEAAKMQPSQVMVMNIVLTAVGVALGLFVNVRYGVLLKNAEEA